MQKFWAILGVILVIAAVVKSPMIVSDITKFVHDVADMI